MGGIRIITTSSVKAASPDERVSIPRVELSPWDLQVLRVEHNQKGLLFHKPKNFSQHNIQHLKTSLSRTLDFFPPLGGRLTIIENDDNTLSFFINCNNAGALFVHAKADGVTLSDIKHSLYVPHHVRSFFLLNGAQNYECTSRPLLAVQATELEDGIFIGCTMNHTVADGTSFWHFFNSWSEISRGSDSVSKPPLLERSFLDGTISTPIRIPLFPNTPGRDQVFDDKVVDEINIPAAVPLLKERIFHFSREKIAQLKAKANAETETENPNRSISSLQVVLAHLWWSIIRIRIGHDLDPDKECSYRLLIRTRSRLNPPLPQQYFGNALQAGTVTMKAGDVLARGTGSVAWEMKKMVASHTEEKARSFLECWVREPELMTVDNMTGKALVTSSSPRFDVYGNDFGWGRPVGVRTGAGNKLHGKISVFSGAEEGSIDVEACLLAETLEAMGNDSEFMDAVTVG